MNNAITYEDFAGTLEFRPTDEQAAVITSNAPAMLVIAGAGSGKTTTMSQRIAWKIVSGQVRPDQVLGLTFTHKAAGELAQSAYKEIENAKRELSAQLSAQKSPLSRRNSTVTGIVAGKDTGVQKKRKPLVRRKYKAS
ncbi:UvrD-helicase domain-containing protein [Arcanobacterium hippocoleae]